MRSSRTLRYTPCSSTPISVGASLFQFLLTIVTLPVAKLLPPSVLYQPEIGPSPAALLVSRSLDRLDVPVHWHGHDDFGLGTAAAIAAVQAGATWVQGTINGMGERAGNADLLEVALALEALYGIPTRLDLTKAREVSRLVAERAGTPLPPWKAVTGEALFTRESGAVAAQFHDPPAIEPYASELVGAERGIVLGKKSGIDSIRITLARLGLEADADDQAALLEAVKRLGTERQALVSDADFKRLVRKQARRADG